MSVMLTVGDIYALVNELKTRGMNLRQIKKLPIYIGNDDELNGIHCGAYRQLVDVENPNDSTFVKLINEDDHNIPLEDKAILIS